MTRRAKRLEWAIGLLALTTAALLLSAAASDRTKPQHPNLQGTWKLNEDLSERMQQDDRAQGGPGGFHDGMGRHGGGGVGRGGGRRGGGFPGGPPGGESGEPGQGERQGEAPPSLAALDVLTITQQGNQLTVTDKDGNTRVLNADRRKVRDEKAPGGPAELRASWDKNGILTVEVRPDHGPKRTESYIVSNDGKHLYVTFIFERDGHDVKIRRAYDPAADEKHAMPEGDEDDDREVFA